MKHASQTADQAQKSWEKSTATSHGRLLPKQAVLAIWETFRIRYQDLWTRKTGTSRQDMERILLDWQKVLKNLSPEDIQRGLDNWDSEFPPNVMQFRTACKKPIKNPAHVMSRDRMLPKPPRNHELGSKALRNIRGLLKT